jgi:hypothetical protein
MLAVVSRWAQLQQMPLFQLMHRVALAMLLFYTD